MIVWLNKIFGIKAKNECYFNPFLGIKDGRSIVYDTKREEKISKAYIEHYKIYNKLRFK